MSLGVHIRKCLSIYMSAAAAAKLLQSCSTLCDPIDSSPPGSPVPGIFQARTLGWVAIYFSSAWKWKVKVKLLSRVRIFATPWIVTYQASPSIGFSRQEYWSGVPLSSPNMLSKVVITFLRRSKCLLISCSDSGAQKNKVWHCFHCFPISFSWSDGTRCHDLSFLNVEL